MAVYSVAFLILISVAPVLLFAFIIHSNDKDKEPFSKLVELFLCGIGSILVTLVITYLLRLVVPFFGYSIANLNIWTLIPYVFIGVALIEEFSKWIFVYLLEYNSKEFKHLYDGIVYATFVSLGFACLENILYVLSNGIGTAIVRAFLAVPGHLCDGIMMGYYLSLAKLSIFNNNKKLSRKNLLFSLLVPVLMHGIYDYLIFSFNITNNYLFIVAFFAFLIPFFIFGGKKVKQLKNTTVNLNPYYITKRDISRKQKQYNMLVSTGQNINYNTYKPDSFNPYINQHIYCFMCGNKLEGPYCSNCGTKNT